MAALDHLREPTRFNDSSGIPQHPESLGRAFPGPTELAQENPETSSKMKGTGTTRTAPESQSEDEALIAWEVQTGEYDVGI